ncbi:hypothetical protein GOZ96_12260 [Agrobacterium vitis]|uniref:Uncharacterized protein n=1 Tax=Agrobacterium vitis TaxID=373 RepID=A0A368NS45_AGRVI|nr:hypothetical protein [Agrobacterium vitis]KAA3516980.1 hypothetical protein DXM22_11035 [Agrobacterium vitis]KAA3529745.1 hypothetical protein DXT89_08560 [Agrobacterium vitis]MUZ97375.1 hypothetical protein [Agrobacterium vitis]NOJ36247.1 hypothetical protein [Agrobacterium vitis]RCU52299.1 hypothetical protein ASB66_019395 [Agrobacterium vitis]
MEMTPLRSYREEFAKRAEWRRDDELRLDQIKQKDEKDKKAEREHNAEEEAMLDMVAVVMATETEIAAFEVELDAYDAATVEALMDNEERLTAVREELKVLLDQAYVLPDGRRVFKTEDGTRVFDERGVEVKDFDPDMIEDWRPDWEKYQNPFERESDLVKQREDILEFQKLQDDIRAETQNAKEDGGMSRERLEELKAKLAEEAPDAVRAKMDRDGPRQDAELPATPKPETTFRPVGKLDMPAL